MSFFWSFFFLFLFFHHSCIRLLVQVCGGLHFFCLCVFSPFAGRGRVQGPQRGKPNQHCDRQADHHTQRAGGCGDGQGGWGGMQVPLMAMTLAALSALHSHTWREQESWLEGIGVVGKLLIN